MIDEIWNGLRNMVIRDSKVKERGLREGRVLNSGFVSGELVIEWSDGEVKSYFVYVNSLIDLEKVLFEVYDIEIVELYQFDTDYVYTKDYLKKFNDEQLKLVYATVFENVDPSPLLRDVNMDIDMMLRIKKYLEQKSI